MSGRVSDDIGDGGCDVLVDIADGGQRDGVEVLAEFDVAVGVPAAHSATANQSDFEGHVVIVIIRVVVGRVGC
jgi:hypothetical protein|tara:strand:+ start:55 stop:273 length:219 start_codon:yes stop_codon:yes gene_type:complete